MRTKYCSDVIRKMNSAGRMDSWSEKGLIILCSWLEDMYEDPTTDAVALDGQWHQYDDDEAGLLRMLSDYGIDPKMYLDKDALEDGLELDDFKREIAEEISRQATILTFNNGWIVENS